MNWFVEFSLERIEFYHLMDIFRGNLSYLHICVFYSHWVLIFSCRLDGKISIQFSFSTAFFWSFIFGFFFIRKRRQTHQTKHWVNLFYQFLSSRLPKILTISSWDIPQCVLKSSEFTGSECFIYRCKIIYGVHTVNALRNFGLCLQLDGGSCKTTLLNR